MKVKTKLTSEHSRKLKKVRTSVQLTLAIFAIIIMGLSTYESRAMPFPHADYFLNPVRVILEPLPINDREFTVGK